MTNQVNCNFIFSIRDAVRTLRDAGINETLIACIVTEIRSAAIQEERMRVQTLFTNNPPYHAPHGEVQDLINTWSPRNE